MRSEWNAVPLASCYSELEGDRAVSLPARARPTQARPRGWQRLSQRMMAGVLMTRLNQGGFTLLVQSEKLREKAALQGNGHSMRAIIGAEL